MDMVRLTQRPAWWHAYADVTPAWFQTYLPLEQAARLIRTYEVQFVPGLLQTPDYARAVVRLGHTDAPEDELRRRVELRTRRQQLLDRDDAPQVWAVLDEAVLRRPIGGPPVMRDQIAALIDLSRRPQVRIQVMPFTAGGHAAAGGAFTLLHLDDPDPSDVVYVERLTGAAYLEEPDEVDQYAVAMDRLAVQAASPRDSLDILRSMLAEAGPVA